MSKQATTSTQDMPRMVMSSDWQQAYLASVGAAGASWLDFVGERFHAYAHVIDDISHCHDLNEAWQIQSTFGQETAKAYREQATKFGGLILKVANGNGSEMSK
ncbi:MAG: hypothetical protein ACR2RE_09445 [Geminicoccaceae bacterium]